MLEVNSLELYKSDSVLKFNEAIELIQKLKSEGKTVGLCHGGFDLTHPGHVKHFESAKKQCDILFVSITSDEFVACRKGSGRPIYTDKLRAYIIANIKFVDYAVISDFKKGVEVISRLKPSFYIKGPDFVNKMTPGIISEREATKESGGEMRYTTELPMSTTGIIQYIKEEIDDEEYLIVVDRDGTIIKNNDFLGENSNWKEELKFNDSVVNYLSYLQTKYKTTKVVITNQTGVARKLFTSDTVEEINSTIHSQLAQKGIKIDNWQYCPYMDLAYAELKKDEFDFDWNFVKQETKRKPSTAMVDDALRELGKDISKFSGIVVLGDRHEDEGLAQNLKETQNLKVKFIDVKEKSYEELVDEFS